MSEQQKKMDEFLELLRAESEDGNGTATAMLQRLESAEDLDDQYRIVYEYWDDLKATMYGIAETLTVAFGGLRRTVLGLINRLYGRTDDASDK